MQLTRYRLLIAVVAVAVWVAITAFWGFWEPRVDRPISAGVSEGMAWNIVGAAAFLLVVVLVCRWRDIGFNAPRPWSSLRVLWFPALYVAVFAAIATFVGWPPLSVIGFLAINSLFVGLSEELAFRGVLFRGLLQHVPIWPAIVITSVLFGSVHVLNGFGTGDWSSAAIQAIAAAMSGLVFLAIMLRTGSIIPAMLLHAAWDFTTLASAVHASHATEASGLTLVTALTPILFEMPNFLYGLFLLRKIGRDGVAQPSAAVA